jgi:hypothetical protein
MGLGWCVKGRDTNIVVVVWWMDEWTSGGVGFVLGGIKFQVVRGGVEVLEVVALLSEPSAGLV